LPAAVRGKLHDAFTARRRAAPFQPAMNFLAALEPAAGKTNFFEIARRVHFDAIRSADW
jgi:hypothetical protein